MSTATNCLLPLAIMQCKGRWKERFGRENRKGGLGMVVREDGKKDRKGEPDGRMEGWTEREGWMGGREGRLGREDKNKKER